MYSLQKKQKALAASARPKRKKRRAVTGWPAARRSKRRRTATPPPQSDRDCEEEEEQEEGIEDLIVDGAPPVEQEHDKYAELADFSRDGESYTWRCVCAVYSEWKDFVDDLAKKTRDRTKVEEKRLYSLLKSDVVPVIQSIEDERIQEEEAKLKEIEKMRIFESRKRSGRGDAMAQRRKEEEERRLELERQEEEKAQRKIERKLRAQREREREERLKTREIKLQEAEARKQEQLSKKIAAAAGGSKPAALQAVAASSPARSDRQSSVDHEPTRRSARNAGRATQQTENVVQRPTIAPGPSRWYFDCYCGIYGDNYDDGELSVCCGKCDIWMHVSHLAPDELRRFEEIAEFQQSKEEVSGDNTELENVKASSNGDNENSHDELTESADSAAANESSLNKDEKRLEPKADVKEEESGGDSEFVCNRCIRLEHERQIEQELERKRELDRARRRERERKREAEKRKLAAEAKAKALQEKREQEAVVKPAAEQQKVSSVKLNLSINRAMEHSPPMPGAGAFVPTTEPQGENRQSGSGLSASDSAAAGNALYTPQQQASVLPSISSTNLLPTTLPSVSSLTQMRGSTLGIKNEMPASSASTERLVTSNPPTVTQPLYQQKLLPGSVPAHAYASEKERSPCASATAVDEPLLSAVTEPKKSSGDAQNGLDILADVMFSG